MLSACVADAGGWPVVVGGRQERRELVSDFGAEPGDGRGADVVLEAAGTEQAWSDAVESCVRAGRSWCSAGCHVERVLGSTRSDCTTTSS